ncbi:hypothetical protein A2Z22_02570 [Candidatus Woesebacteria bacterium RBG_16_34_12]|uniref:Uncharacterized protein n=2 Tax=Candidatus Woeseibacteriota TaxID=1752722 RepID=A0A1F7X2Z9_9BACT|nr:MAG: hypothetical protein A2159_03660 [Candidatus Woesebacteria bacterium RBG_13_34_9]OGM11661.1 MAG: hypothetical protein A2Z22_02570 [Candidatus Woesebacteria bacterium RBG_16_34_12]
MSGTPEDRQPGKTYAIERSLKNLFTAWGESIVRTPVELGLYKGNNEVKIPHPLFRWKSNTRTVDHVDPEIGTGDPVIVYTQSAEWEDES